MVEMVGIRQVMWFLMIESAKYRVIGVDIPGQQVSPHIWYEMTYLLIRNAIKSVSYSNE
jgi:hypothetical protein